MPRRVGRLARRRPVSARLGQRERALTALGHTYDTSTSKRGSYGAVIVGAYGQLESGPNWSIPYSFAEGLGTPSSWQGLIGLRYHRVSLSWRYVQYNAGSSTSLVQRLSLGGPLIGYGFRCDDRRHRMRRTTIGLRPTLPALRSEPADRGTAVVRYAG